MTLERVTLIEEIRESKRMMPVLSFRELREGIERLVKLINSQTPTGPHCTTRTNEVF